MPLPDLITTPRAVQNAQLAALGTTNLSQLQSLITAASDAIRRYCHRDFSLTSYSEYYSGGIYIKEPLKLRQFPVTQISRVAIANIALQVLNSGGANQRATIQTLANGDLQLTTVASGVVSTDTIAAASNLTIGAVATAINNLGNGWGTSIYSGPAGSYANFPTTDLRPLQGAVSCLIGGSYLEVFEDWYGWNTVSFWPDETYESSGVAAFWRPDNETGEIHGRLPRGKLNIRIDYTAGFATIPAAVQEACVQLVQWMYQSSLHDQTLKMEKLGVATYELGTSTKWPPSVLNALSYFKAYDRTLYWD